MHHSPKAGSMLGQRRRQMSNIDPASDERVVFAGFDRVFIKVINVVYHNVA